MDKVLLGDIYHKGFIFRKYEPNSIIHHRLKENTFNPVKTNDDSSYGVYELHYFIKDFFMSLWKNAGINIHNCTFRVRELKQNNYVELHTPMMETQYKAIIFCPESNYEGAEFVFGNNEKLNYQKLEFGDIVFCKTGDENYISGFRKLESKESIRYIEIYGALNLSKPIEDQTYEGIEINSLKLN